MPFTLAVTAYRGAADFLFEGARPDMVFDMFGVPWMIPVGGGPPVNTPRCILVSRLSGS
jgi:hypothetical protein